jgi:hypothetical protein
VAAHCLGHHGAHLAELATQEVQGIALRYLDRAANALAISDRPPSTPVIIAAASLPKARLMSSARQSMPASKRLRATRSPRSLPVATPARCPRRAC